MNPGGLCRGLVHTSDNTHRRKVEQRDTSIEVFARVRPTFILLKSETNPIPFPLFARTHEKIATSFSRPCNKPDQAPPHNPNEKNDRTSLQKKDSFKAEAPGTHQLY